MCKKFCLSIVFCLAFMSLGCQKGPKKPENMPNLIPCTLSLKTDAGPLADANIELFTDPFNPGDRWTYKGKTDETGKAKISTMAEFSGVPQGKYVVVVSKSKTILTPQKDGRTRNQTFMLIDQKYTNKNTTPIKIEAQQTAIDQTIDLGKSQEKLIDDSTI